MAMDLWEQCKGVLKIQKFRRTASYAAFYCFTCLITYAYTSNTTRAGMSRADQFYAAYPAGTELLTDTAKLYKAALGNCFEEEDWGPIEFSIIAKHFERQGKPPYAYHSGSGGVTIKKTNMSLIIGIYDEPMTPGQCNMIVERLGDYLCEQGF